MTPLEEKLAAFLYDNTRLEINEAHDLSIDIVQFLTEEYDRQVDEALNGTKS